MKPKDFDAKYKTLVDEMYIRINDPERGREVIADGVHSADKYFHQDIRLVWMLKEPYDEGGGGWNYWEMFDGDDLYESQFKKGHKTTWHPIIYTSHGILNGFKKWEEIDFIRNNHDLAKIVREVAFINAQKLPSLGGTRTNMEDIRVSIKKYGDILLRQIELLNPNVFIFANTFNSYIPLLNLNEAELIHHGSCSYVAKEGKLYINAYHPAQTQVGGNVYTNDIVEVVKNWFNKK